jgi:hypothetical protein
MSGAMRMVSIFSPHRLHLIFHLIAGTATTTPVLSHVVRSVEAVFQAHSVINLNLVDMCAIAVRQTVQETSEVWPSMPIWCVIYRRDDSI